MKSKIITYAIIGVMLVVAVWLGRRNNNGNTTAPSKTTSPTTPRVTRERETNSGSDTRGFIRKVSYLEYTVHAKCRMACRHITQEEVKDIMQNGKINYSKSGLNDNPCPTYALEGYTLKDNQHVRIVFAQCLQKTKVVTCIDLENEFACACK